MDSALAGLVGAGIGAIAGLTGALINYRFTSRLQHANWLRDKRHEAYTSTLRYILRLSGKRSGITAEGTIFLGQDAIKEMFDDFSDARSWLSALSIYCSETHRKTVAQSLERLTEVADGLLSNKQAADRKPFQNEVAAIRNIVLEAARDDLQKYIP